MRSNQRSPLTNNHTRLAAVLLACRALQGAAVSALLITHSRTHSHAQIPPTYTHTVLLACRALQGAAVSALMVAANAVLADTWAPAVRGKAMGVFAVPTRECAREWLLLLSTGVQCSTLCKTTWTEAESVQTHSDSTAHAQLWAPWWVPSSAARCRRRSGGAPPLRRWRSWGPSSTPHCFFSWRRPTTTTCCRWV